MFISIQRRAPARAHQIEVRWSLPARERDPHRIVVSSGHRGPAAVNAAGPDSGTENEFDVSLNPTSRAARRVQANRGHACSYWRVGRSAPGLQAPRERSRVAFPPNGLGFYEAGASHPEIRRAAVKLAHEAAASRVSRPAARS